LAKAEGGSKQTMNELASIYTGIFIAKKIASPTMATMGIMQQQCAIFMGEKGKVQDITLLPASKVIRQEKTVQNKGRKDGKK